MIIYLGADHKGFKLKGYIAGILKDHGYEIFDLGNFRYDQNDDYPDFARAVAEKVSRDYENARGILICGSGVGVDVVANKFPGVRSALVFNTNQAFDSRNDDNANILSLSADYLNLEDAKKIVLTWLETPFSEEERHIRRIQKINQIEEENFREEVRGNY